MINIQIGKLKKREISIEDFKKVVLKVAKIRAAERVPGSDNLIQCQIEIGDAKRQIVAGIGKHYQPEDLIGRTIIVVENLKPVKIHGVLSQGMLLAAEGKEGFVLLTTDKEIKSGAVIR